MLLSCTENSTDKTYKNSNNLINKTIKNDNKKLLENKKRKKSLTNAKTLGTTDNFISTCLEHPANNRNLSNNDNYSEITNRNINNENRDNNKTNIYILGDSMVKKN